MEVYFGLFITCYANIYVFSQNTVCNSSSDICKPYTLNGHYIQWPNKKVEADYLYNKNFIPKNIVFTRAQICGNQAFFVSPRYKEGVPFTLGHMLLNGKDKATARSYNYVRPFPTLEKNAVDDSKAIVNAVDIYMGQNGILWVLDIGVVNTLEEKPKKECEAKVLGINYGNGRIIHTIPLRSFTCRVRTRLQFLVVEYVADDKPIVYIGDGGTRSVIVWNVRGNEGYKVKLPSTSTITCTGCAAEDVFYLVLVEKSNSTYIYFTYLSSSDLFKVRTKDLRKRMNPRCVVSVGRKPCKMVILGSAYGSVIYFRIKGLKHLYSWDARDGFLEENMMLVKKSIDCRTITHIDVDNDGVLWELESNIEDFIANAVGCYGASVILSPIYERPLPLDQEERSCDVSRR